MNETIIYVLAAVVLAAAFLAFWWWDARRAKGEARDGERLHADPAAHTHMTPEQRGDTDEYGR